LPGLPGQKGDIGVSGIPAPMVMPNYSAFFVALMNNTGPFNEDRTIVFDTVITNYGNSYSSQTGIFTVKFSGIYQFFITISATGRQKVLYFFPF
jgi:hypothetical protein